MMNRTLLSQLALALTFSLGFAACDDDDDSGGSVNDASIRVDGTVDPDDGVLDPDDGVLDPDSAVAHPDGAVDPDDGVAQLDGAVDPDDGVAHLDGAVDPDDGVPHLDGAVDPDDGVTHLDGAIDPDDGVVTDEGVEEGFEEGFDEGFEEGVDGGLDGTVDVDGTVDPDGGPVSVEVVLVVDLTGEVIAPTSFIALTNPPPPDGTGVAHVVGNLPAIGSWTPNSVALQDDGVAPDETAADNLWTLSFETTVGTNIQYKYTCGDPGSGWNGTEEFPLTNRGFTVVPAEEGRILLKVQLNDVFADRPLNTTELGPLTEITYTYAP